MEPVSRRSFISKGSMGAVGAVGALAGGPALLAAMTTESSLTEEEINALEGPLFVQVRDAATGEIEILVNETSVVFNDQALVAKVLRAAK